MAQKHTFLEAKEPQIPFPLYLGTILKKCPEKGRQ